MLFDAPDDPLARFYPSITGERVPPGDPAPDLAAFAREHAHTLGEMIATRATQTNEVNRSVAVAAGLRAAAADLPDTPLALVELGPSAGLNLLADTYAIDAGHGALHQRPASPVVLRTRLAGDGRPGLDAPLPPVVDRAGVDLHPIDVWTDDEVRWLEACLWPEQTERLARFRAAVIEARAAPPRLVEGDLLDDLPALLDTLPPEAHAFVFHSWVLTYVARTRRPDLATILRAAAARRPVSWYSAEAPGVVPDLPAGVAEEGGLTLLGLTTFRSTGEHSRVVGTCHPHLAWLDWQG
jgi:hypothetical protein